MKEVYEYPTESKWGFTQEEIEELLKNYPDIDREKFDDAMMGNTCAIEGGKIRNYHCDVARALRCGIEKRYLRLNEWD